MSRHDPLPPGEQPNRSLLSPFVYESERRVPQDIRKVFTDAIWRWNEKYGCVSWVGVTGRRSDKEVKLLVGLDFLPDGDALKELNSELEPLIGSIVFHEMHYTETRATGADHD